MNDGLQSLTGRRLLRPTDTAFDWLHTSDGEAAAAIESARGYTMVDIHQQFLAYALARYIAEASLPGDLVECGVWRGGVSALMLRGLMAGGANHKRLWMYDTFQGMTAPSDKDLQIQSGRSAQEILSRIPKMAGKKNEWNEWCFADEDDVRRTVSATGYPGQNINIVKGDVAVSLTEEKPRSISLLRLDTDWYESTRVELDSLYPLVEPGGFVIVDDYDDWSGARLAVDEFLCQLPVRPPLIKVGEGRLLLKPTTSHY